MSYDGDDSIHQTEVESLQKQILDQLCEITDVLKIIANLDINESTRD